MNNSNQQQQQLYRPSAQHYSPPYSTDSNANQDKYVTSRSGSSSGQYSRAAPDAEVSVPVYAARPSGGGDTFRYPSPAESRLVYSSQPAPSFSYAQSRPADQSPPPPTPPAAPQGGRSSSPPLPPPPETAPYSPSYQAPPDSPKHPLGQPYQLASTMESGGGGGGRRVENQGKEQEVDALTNLLMQNMEAAADPDFFGELTSCQQSNN